MFDVYQRRLIHHRSNHAITVGQVVGSHCSYVLDCKIGIVDTCVSDSFSLAGDYNIYIYIHPHIHIYKQMRLYVECRPFQICGGPFREPRVFEIAHM